MAGVGRQPYARRAMQDGKGKNKQRKDVVTKGAAGPKHGNEVGDGEGGNG